jgi:hypothetical protein
VDVPEERNAILEALRSLPTGIAPSMHFGRGESGRLFRECLLNPQFWETCPQKQFRDVSLVSEARGA